MIKNRLVSRAENKLAEAVKRFGLPSDFFVGKTVLDIGSSTGGFTELALRGGAKRVIAVEKGTRQMVAPLRFDQRICLLEKTDFLEFEADEKIDIVLADVSFVSLKKILEHAKEIFGVVGASGSGVVGTEERAKDKKKQGEEVNFLVMLKPQFEAREEELNRGVVKNEKIRRKIILICTG